MRQINILSLVAALLLIAHKTDANQPIGHPSPPKPPPDDVIFDLQFSPEISKKYIAARRLYCTQSAIIGCIAASFTSLMDLVFKGRR